MEGDRWRKLMLVHEFFEVKAREIDEGWMMDDNKLLG